MFSVVQNINKLMSNLETIQREHRNTLLNFEREKKLKCDNLKAAQVSYSRITLNDSSWVKEQVAKSSLLNKTK